MLEARRHQVDSFGCEMSTSCAKILGHRTRTLALKQSGFFNGSPTTVTDVSLCLSFVIKNKLFATPQHSKLTLLVRINTDRIYS